MGVGIIIPLPFHYNKIESNNIIVLSKGFKNITIIKMNGLKENYKKCNFL